MPILQYDHLGGGVQPFLNLLLEQICQFLYRLWINPGGLWVRWL